MGFKFSGARVDPAAWSIKVWKQVAVRVEPDGTYILCNGPGFVMAECIAADETGPGTITIYDGHSAAGRIVWYDQAVLNHAHGLVFKVPIYCDRGITVVIAASVYGSVQWLPWNP